MTTIQEFDYSVNNVQSLLWQFNEAIHLIALIEQKQEWYDVNQEQFWQDWFNNVFDLSTANEFGLTVWSIILDLPYFVNTGTDDRTSLTLFGFNQVTSYPTYENTYQNYNGIGTTPPSDQLGANFSNIGTRFILSDDQQRFILRLRFFQLVTDGDIPGINAFLHYLTTSSPEPLDTTIWALDGFNMTMRYIFGGALPELFLYLLSPVQLDLLPRPATVGVAYIDISRATWGFNEVISYPDYENTYLNFENGNFYNIPGI